MFDMDGTLVRSELDFDAIAAEVGVPRDVPLLEAVRRLPPARQAEAEQVLLRHEHAAARACELLPGAVELLDALARWGMPAGLLTRNCRACVDIVVGRHALRLDPLLAREDAPAKPAPDGILLAARRWGVPPSEVLMVGDYVFDVRAGRAAGSLTALLTEGVARPFDDEADYLLPDLSAAIPLLQTLRA